MLAALRESRFVHLEEVRTLNDVKLLYISWVFDLNFPASFREMRKGRYIERLSASMPATADVIECVRMAREHLSPPGRARGLTLVLKSYSKQHD